MERRNTCKQSRRKYWSCAYGRNSEEYGRQDEGFLWVEAFFEYLLQCSPQAPRSALHICASRSLSPSCPVSSDFCPVPAGQGLSSCCPVCLREVALGHDVWLHVHSHTGVSAVKQDSNICCVLLFLFCWQINKEKQDRKNSLWQLSSPVGVHILQRFILKFDILYAELLK